MEPEVLTATRHAAFKVGLQLLVQSPARAVVVAEAVMDQKEMAGMVVPAVLVVGMMVQLAVVVIRHQLPHRKVIMVAIAREAGALKSAVEAGEQELLAERELPAARQEMEERGLTAVLVALQPLMQVEAVVIEQSMGVPAMVALAVEAMVGKTAKQTLVVAVAAVEQEVGLRMAVPAS